MNEQWKSTNGDTVQVFSRPVLTRSLLRTRVKGLTWHWHVRAAGNNEIVAHGEAYRRRIDAVSTAERLFPRVEDET